MTAPSPTSAPPGSPASPKLAETISLLGRYPLLDHRARARLSWLLGRLPPAQRAALRSDAPLAVKLECFEADHPPRAHSPLPGLALAMLAAAVLALVGGSRLFR